jgi:hypothetical protein
VQSIFREQIDGKALDDCFAGGGADAARELWITQDTTNRAGDFCCIRSCRKKAVTAALDDFGYAATGHGNRRQAVRHRREQRRAQRFGERRKNKDV